MNDTLCKLHRTNENKSHKEREKGADERDDSFPRIATVKEIRQWVNNSRAKTDPFNNIMKSCVICGRLHRVRESTTVTDLDLMNARALLSRDGSGQASRASGRAAREFSHNLGPKK